MRNEDYYPAGAANDPNAPYNEVEPEAVAFDVDATFTIVKTVELCTKQYEGGYVDEEGYKEPYDTLGVDWQAEYKEQSHTPKELLERLADLVEENLDHIQQKMYEQHPEWRMGYIKTKMRQYKYLVASARGWEIIEENYEEV